MKRMTWMILAIAALFVSTTGCGEAMDGTSGEWPLEEELDEPDLEGVFVSGHLGNYMDCPEDGYTVEEETESSADAGASEPPGDEPGYADCDSDADECGGITNCEDAQVTVQLSNLGEVAARGLEVSRIELFDAEGNSRATLPVTAVSESETNQVFDGELATDAEQTLRIDFVGPADPRELLETSDSGADRSGAQSPGVIEVTISSDNQEDVVIESNEIYPVPMVVT